MNETTSTAFWTHVTIHCRSPCNTAVPKSCMNETFWHLTHGITHTYFTCCLLYIKIFIVYILPKFIICLYVCVVLSMCEKTKSKLLLTSDFKLNYSKQIKWISISSYVILVGTVRNILQHRNADNKIRIHFTYHVTKLYSRSNSTTKLKICYSCIIINLVSHRHNGSGTSFHT